MLVGTIFKATLQKKSNIVLAALTKMLQCWTEHC